MADLVTTTDVAVVGAGMAGVGLAVRLRRAGFRDVLVLERGGDVGGTWRDNTYPGVACDIPSHLYALSFLPNPHWSRRFAPGAEIHDYLRRSAREEGILGQVRLGTDVRAMTWDEGRRRWRLETGSGPVEARVLVVAAGRLADPWTPDLPGLAGFPGPVVHSARWDPALDLREARVGVVGTGASAVQLVPALADRVGELVVFQRSAPWVVPRDDRAFTAAERAAFVADPGAIDAERDRVFAEMEAGHSARRGDQQALGLLRARARGHLDAQVPDPALRARLTPDHEVGCKRVLLSDDWYPTLQRPDVRLVPAALERLDGPRAVAADGSTHELDVLVTATGFRAAEPVWATRVVGRAGQRLSERWAVGGMTSYRSSAVPGFPNMFVVDGPNAALGHNSGAVMIETQIDYVLGAVRRCLGDGHPVLEATPEAEAAYTREIDAAAAGTVWLTGCDSWYVDPRHGRLTLLWPGTATSFREANGRFSDEGYAVTHP